jgi:hypothetical protein
MHPDSKKRRSFLALLLTAGDVKRYCRLRSILLTFGKDAPSVR